MDFEGATLLALKREGGRVQAKDGGLLSELQKPRARVSSEGVRRDPAS